jgi:endoribonuclease Dicer
LEVERRYNIAFYSLGPISANQYLFSEIRSRLNVAINADAYYEDNEASEGASLASLPPDLLHIQSILLDFELFFPDDHSTTDASLDCCTPKVKELVDILKNHVTPTFQGIVFVEQRHIAICLAILLSSLPELKGLVKCQYLLGGGTRNEGISMVGPKPGEVVKLFRDKEINLREYQPLRIELDSKWVAVIATSVAEEGLDFPVRIMLTSLRLY